MNLSRAPFRVQYLLALMLILSLSLFAQQRSPSPEPQHSQDQFRLKRYVNRVILDVVVTDANGKPVHGLNQRDFTVSEDGVKQKILSFDARELGAGASFVSKAPALPANTFANVLTAPEQGPLYVLLLDLQDTRPDDQPYARQQLLKFVSSKPPGTRYAIFVLSNGLHLVEGFTSDRDKLYAAVDPSHPKSHVPRILINNYDWVSILDALDNIADFLQGLPGRKNVIWVSGSFPLALFAAAGVDPAYQAKVVETLRGLAQTEMSVYPIDVRGVVTSSDPKATSMMVMLLAQQYEVEDEIARITGGQAFYSRNDLKAVLSDVTELGGDYYSIAYSPSNHNYAGELRQVRVSLSRSGDHLEYRHSYYAYPQKKTSIPAKARDSSQEPPSGALYANMRHGAPIMRQVLFRVHIYPLGAPMLATPEQLGSLAERFSYFHARQESEGNKSLAVKLQTYFLDYVILGRVPIIEIATAVYDSDGNLLNTDIEHTVPADTSKADEPGAGKFYRIQQRFEAPVNAAYMRIGVRDVTTDRIGVLEVSLPLPPLIPIDAR